MKIKDVERLYNQRQAESKELRRRIEETQGKLARISKEADAAAGAGDLDAYRAKKAEARDAEEELYVLQRQVKSDTVSRDEGLAAWSDYRKDYDKEFQKRMKALEQAGDALADAFLAAVKHQNEGLQNREKVAVYAGIDAADLTLQTMPDTPAGSIPRPVFGSLPEVVYMFASGRWTFDAAAMSGYGMANGPQPVYDKVLTVIRQRKPQDF